MRDKEGRFVGNNRCIHLTAFDHYEDRECCGGRQIKVGFCTCDIHGVVEAEKKCNGVCPDKEEGKNPNAQAILASLNAAAAEEEQPEEAVEEPVEAAEDVEKEPESEESDEESDV